MRPRRAWDRWSIGAEFFRELRDSLEGEASGTSNDAQAPPPARESPARRPHCLRF